MTEAETRVALKAALQKCNDAVVGVEAIMQKAKADIVSTMLPAIAEAYAALDIVPDLTPLPAPAAPAPHVEGPKGPTLKVWEGPQDDPSAAYSADGKTFARDYWVAGRMGAVKGAQVHHYAVAWQILSMMGGTAMSETRVMSDAPLINPLTGNYFNWNEALVSASALGWSEPTPAEVADPNWKLVHDRIKARAGR